MDRVPPGDDVGVRDDDDRAAPPQHRMDVAVQMDQVGAEAALPPGLAAIHQVPKAPWEPDDPLALLPRTVRWGFVHPALRAAVEARLAAEPFDVVQYEYVEMGQIMPTPTRPTILTVVQLGFAAARDEWRAGGGGARRAAIALYRYLRDLDFELTAAARAHHVITMSAERSRQRGFHQLAVDLLSRALAVIPQDEDAARRDVLLVRADARANLHEPGAARADIDSALTSASAKGDQRAVARALTVLGHVEQSEGSFDASSATLERAVRIWRDVGDEHGEAEALSQLGTTRSLMGDPDGAEEALTSALATFRTLGSRREEAWVLWNLAEIAYALGRLPEAEERLGEAGATFAEAGDWGGLGWTKGLLGFVRYFQGRREEAEELAVHILGEVRQGGDRWALAMVQHLLSSVALWQGRTDEAIERSQEAGRLFRQLDNSDALRADGVLIRARAAAGDVDAAFSLAREALMTALSNEGSNGWSSSKAGNVYGLVQGAGLVLAGAAIHVGDGEQALAVLSEVSQLSTGAVSEVATTEVDTAHGAALAQVGRFDEAIERLEQAGAGAVAAGPRANALSLLALACAGASRPDRAIEAARAAASLHEATYLDRAVIVPRRGDSGSVTIEVARK